jgi:hypothetical protein
MTVFAPRTAGLPQCWPIKAGAPPETEDSAMQTGRIAAASRQDWSDRRAVPPSVALLMIF